MTTIAMSSSKFDIESVGPIPATFRPNANKSIGLIWAMLGTEHELTELGRTLRDPLQALGRWAEDNFSRMQAARQEYDARRTSSGQLLGPDLDPNAARAGSRPPGHAAQPSLYELTDEISAPPFGKRPASSCARAGELVPVGWAQISGKRRPSRPNGERF